MATIREALAVALDHHLAGRRLEAETLYRRILDADAGNPDALHLLGVLCAQTGRIAEAIRQLTAAVAGNPTVPDYHVNLGNALQVAGRFDEAAGCHRAALERAPGRADAGFGLAVALGAAGRRDEEAVALDTHLRHHPGHAEAWTRLGLALRAMGRVEDAIAPLTEAARRAPLDAGVQANLGLTLLALGRDAQPVFRRVLALDPAFARVLAAVAEEAEREDEPAWAERFHRRALRLDPDRAASQAALARLRRDAPDAVAQRRRALVLSPDDVDGWNEQGLLDRRAVRMTAAAVALRRALRLRPDLAALRSNLAVTLRALGQPEPALLQARLALALDPGDAGIAGNLAMAFETMDQPAMAALWIGRGLRLWPQDAAGWAYRGAMLRRSGRIADGLAAGERAVTLEPDGLGGWQNRAAILQDLGRTGAGIAANRRALVLDPGASGLHSNLLLALHYSPEVGPMDLLEEHRRWDARHGRPLAPSAGFRHPNPPDPERRLRVGYVSADFGYHPVGYFLAPVLPAHDRAAVEVFCYNAKPREDGMTRRLRAAADQWRSLCGVDDEAAAAMIAADGIDILVDLAGHTAGNRLPLFARKPAPLQVTWAGYVGTTGLSAMDALIACPRQMPPGSEATAVERVLRLPDDYVCVLPRENAPAVGSLPARTNGFVTFGCFNNRAKLSGPTLALWARLLARVPGARLLLKTHQFDDPVVRAGLLAEFAAAGGDPERVDFSGTARHFDLPDWYNRIDVALDPFPYSGGLTTLEALWMGVPVVTLGGGDRFCARHSVAHLTAAGLPELIAGSPDAYLAIAAGLAADHDRLAALRAGLRDRMAAGPLCDGPRFTRHLEAAYRDLWRGWCAA